MVRQMVNVTVRPMVNVILKPTEMPMDWVRQKDFYLAKRMENATDLHWVMRTVTVRPVVNVTVRPMVSVTLKPTVRPMDWVRQSDFYLSRRMENATDLHWVMRMVKVKHWVKQMEKQMDLHWVKEKPMVSVTEKPTEMH